MGRRGGQEGQPGSLVPKGEGMLGVMTESASGQSCPGLPGPAVTSLPSPSPIQQKSSVSLSPWRCPCLPAGQQAQLFALLELGA